MPLDDPTFRRGIHCSSLAFDHVRASSTRQVDMVGSSVFARFTRCMCGSVEVPLDQPLEKTIHQLLVAVLEAEKGNRARTAQRLGVSLRTVQRHLARNPA
jgi:DNA-binding NtrC family response regulator